jgi:hypothetical protein
LPRNCAALCGAGAVDSDVLAGYGDGARDWCGVYGVWPSTGEVPPAFDFVATFDVELPFSFLSYSCEAFSHLADLQ